MEMIKGHCSDSKIKDFYFYHFSFTVFDKMELT